MPQWGIPAKNPSGVFVSLQNTPVGYHAAMKLRDYLRTNSLTVKAFAQSIGEADAVVRKWVYGQRQPSLPNAIKVENATGGLVASRDMLLPRAEPAADPTPAEA